MKSNNSIYSEYGVNNDNTDENNKNVADKHITAAADPHHARVESVVARNS